MKPTASIYQYVGAFESMLASITKKQSADLTVDLSNVENFKYTTTIYVGSDSQPLDVKIDTGSNRLVLLDSSCVECQFTFNSTDSSTFSPSSTTDVISYLDGSAIKGFKVNDTVALAQGYEVDNFNFLLGLI